MLWVYILTWLFNGWRHTTARWSSSRLLSWFENGNSLKGTGRRRKRFDSIWSAALLLSTKMQMCSCSTLVIGGLMTRPQKGIYRKRIDFECVIKFLLVKKYVAFFRQDYYQQGSHVYSELNVLEAFRRAMKTWGRWVDANVNPRKSLVFFRGYSASHYK